MVTESRLRCAQCGEMTPLDGIWRELAPGLCWCLRCHDSAPQQQRSDLATDADSIAAGLDAEVKPDPNLGSDGLGDC